VHELEGELGRRRSIILKGSMGRRERDIGRVGRKTMM